MSDSAQIRRDNLKSLGLTPTQPSERVGSRVSYWSELASGSKSFGEKAARKIESALSLPPGWMDADHGKESTPDAGYQVDAAGTRHHIGLRRVEWQELGGPMLIGNEALVTVGTREMSPGVNPGDRVEVSRSAPVEPGRLILCRDSAGGWHLRRVQDIGGGKWQAVSADPAAWAPIQSVDLDEVIRVVMVMQSV